MQHVVENTALISALQSDLSDETKWVALADSQSTVPARVAILRRAVETVPASQDLWERLVDATADSDRIASFQIISDALSLFPKNVPLWLRMFSLFPSVETYTTALRYIDNQLVWHSYLQFLHQASEVSSSQRAEAYICYAEFVQSDPSVVGDLARRLAACGQMEDSLRLLQQHAAGNWELWEPLIVSDTASASLLDAAAQVFPTKDGIIISILARKHASSGDDSKLRALLLSAIERPSSVASFCALFRTACDFYELKITALLKEKGQGSTEVARMLAEFGNLLRKRPMYLSDVAVREFPNDVGLWKQRAALWKNRPHIAADIMETALATIDPARAYSGELSDIWVSYTRLLVSNGSDLAVPRNMLVKALSTHFATVSEKAKLYIALAELEQDGAKDASAAVRILEEALNIHALASNERLWTAYISTLIETHSNNVLEAFSNSCTKKTVTMRIVLMVAKSFADATANQLVVFDKGVELFPFPLVLPLWKHYLVAVQSSFSIHELRGLYERALKASNGHKKATEELLLMYSRIERQSPNGSRLLARRAVAPSVTNCKNAALWLEFIDLHDEALEKRHLYEQAIETLDDREACQVALLMASFEENSGEIERARAIFRYAMPISEGLEDERAALLSEWSSLESAHGDDNSRRELDAILKPHERIRFVPAVEAESWGDSSEDNK